MVYIEDTMSKYKKGDKFIVISSNMNSVKIGDILEYKHEHRQSNIFVASGWAIKYDLTVNGFPQTKLQLLEETKVNEINIEVPEGFIIDEENSSFTCIKFKKKEVTCWEDLNKITGYFVDSDSTIDGYTGNPIFTNDAYRNVFATKEQAEASIALAMLSQLMKDVNGDWIPDWDYYNQSKHTISFYNSKIDTGVYTSTQRFLSFPTLEIRDTFLKNHEELIMKAKYLL